MGCCGSNSESKVGEMTANSSALAGQIDGQPVTFTEAAVAAIANAIKEEGQEGDGLRVSVVGGGCSGYQYNLDFERESRMGDITLNCGGVNIFVDPISAGYLQGTVIDFISGLNGSGFKFNNPNAKRTCGCGSSFS